MSVLPVRCTLLSITARNAGRLLALADVELDFDGVPVTINSVRANGASVRLPVDRDGRPLVVRIPPAWAAFSTDLSQGMLPA